MNNCQNWHSHLFYIIIVASNPKNKQQWIIQNLPGDDDLMIIIFDGGTGNINGPGSDIQHEWELLLDDE